MLVFDYRPAFEVALSFFARFKNARAPEQHTATGWPDVGIIGFNIIPLDHTVTAPAVGSDAKRCLPRTVRACAHERVFRVQKTDPKAKGRFGFPKRPLETRIEAA